MSETDPQHPPSRADATEPVEVQHYGPPHREPLHRATWDEAPSWSNRRQAVQAVETRRGLGAAPVIAIALVGGILSGALSAVAVMNVMDPGSAALTPASSATPDSQPVSDVRIDESSAVIEAVGRVAPAVVTVTTSGAGLLGSSTGTGSGIIFDPDGWILTNRHVVEDANTLTVTLNDGRVYEGATIYGLDTLTDLAIVKIDATGLPAAPIGTSDNLRPGQLAIAIGNPLGYENTVTTGIVSGLGRQILASDAVQASDPERLRNLIQTDAAINPGNSGGPLVNSAGQVIGINTAVSTTAQGLGFAIPIDVARPIMGQALAGQELARPYIGVWYTPINPALAESEDLPVDYGAYIATSSGQEPVLGGSPAEAAGLQAGDVIVAVNGEQLTAEADLQMSLLPYEPGDTITLRVLRGNSVREIELTLGVQPAN
ncbi:MAG TPA: trypsin-like peptidase domain-containing protein [Candidatus Angelobacter sp.]|nr:trypsin-like peptidase domain-containing protein [Candidatus Angelobacter sp.]